MTTGCCDRPHFFESSLTTGLSLWSTHNRRMWYPSAFYLGARIFLASTRFSFVLGSDCCFT